RRVARMHPDADSRRDPGVRLGSSGSAGLHRLIAISYWLLAIRQEPDFGWGDLLPAVLLQRGLPGCLSKAQRADVHTLDPLAEHRIPHRRRVARAVDSMPWADRLLVLDQARLLQLRVGRDASVLGVDPEHEHAAQGYVAGCAAPLRRLAARA